MLLKFERGKKKMLLKFEPEICIYKWRLKKAFQVEKQESNSDILTVGSNLNPLIIHIWSLIFSPM